MSCIFRAPPAFAPIEAGNLTCLHLGCVSMHTLLACTLLACCLTSLNSRRLEELNRALVDTHVDAVLLVVLQRSCTVRPQTPALALAQAAAPSSCYHLRLSQQVGGTELCRREAGHHSFKYRGVKALVAWLLQV